MPWWVSAGIGFVLAVVVAVLARLSPRKDWEFIKTGPGWVLGAIGMLQLVWVTWLFPPPPPAWASTIPTGCHFDRDATYVCPPRPPFPGLWTAIYEAFNGQAYVTWWLGGLLDLAADGVGIVVGFVVGSIVLAARRGSRA
jgi:hypothetical protein